MNILFQNAKNTHNNNQCCLFKKIIVRIDEEIQEGQRVPAVLLVINLNFYLKFSLASVIINTIQNNNAVQT